MRRSYGKRTANGSKQPRNATLSDRELLRSARDSARAHAYNQAKRERIEAADRDNKRNEP